LTRQTSVRAYAKINLSLRVLCRRPDNFHELRTVFQTISLADDLQISFTPARATRISIANSTIPDNLIECAARRCLDEMGVRDWAADRRMPRRFCWLCPCSRDG
jgi:4-diphosphocytidyl-2-C-methyl-D-erythritol kinase